MNNQDSKLETKFKILLRRNRFFYMNTTKKWYEIRHLTVIQGFRNSYSYDILGGGSYWVSATNIKYFGEDDSTAYRDNDWHVGGHVHLFKLWQGGDLKFSNTLTPAMKALYVSKI